MADVTLPVDAMSTRLGFVVIGCNEGDRLVRCFESVMAAGTFHVAYVDSGSTDQSVAEAETRGMHVVQLDLSRPFTAGRARNEGLAALRNHVPQLEFVQFVDGDCALEPNWLASALSFMDERPDVDIVCGRRRERHPEASIYNQLCDIEWNTPVGEADACGGDALVRIASFLEIGGFDTRLIAGEEPELCYRLRAKGGKIWRLDVAMTLHDAAMHRFNQWWMRGIRSGFGYAQVWIVTRRQRRPLYHRELLRAVFWAGLVPFLLIAIAIMSPGAGLAMTGIYGLQVMRTAIRRGVTEPQSWSYGFFAQLAKFPELQGIMRFGWQSIRGGVRSAILYK